VKIKSAFPFFETGAIFEAVEKVFLTAKHAKAFAKYTKTNY
jgi:hypothetical protein